MCYGLDYKVVTGLFFFVFSFVGWFGRWCMMLVFADLGCGFGFGLGAGVSLKLKLSALGSRV